MKRNPFHAGWAGRYLEAIERGEGIACDPELVRIANASPRTDKPYLAVESDSMLRHLIEANPTNRMALEYLTAQLLLAKDLPGIAQQAQKLSKAGYREVPSTVQQAVLLYEQLQNGRKVELGELGVSAGTKEQFERMNAVVQQHGQRWDALRGPLANEFGDTFWYYYLFAGNPAN